MPPVARQILIHYIRRPQRLGAVSTSSRLISRAGRDGESLQELGKKGSRQTIHFIAFFSSLANAWAWANTTQAHQGKEARIKSAVGPAAVMRSVDIQGLIHKIDMTDPYAVTTSHSRNFTHAIDVDIDYTRSI